MTGEDLPAEKDMAAAEVDCVPCQHCHRGPVAVVRRRSPCVKSGHVTKYFAICRGCTLGTGDFDSRSDAVRVWNKNAALLAEAFGNALWSGR